MNKAIITTVTVLLVLGVCNVPPLYADLVWDSGHHEFSEGYEWEVWLLNDTTADITGGEIGQLLCWDTSEVFVYEPSEIDLIKPFESATVNIYGGTITTVFTTGSSLTNVYGGLLDEIEATDLSTLSLYVESYELDPTGGTFGDGLLTGMWLYGGSFTINLVIEETIDHINFVPEPCSAVFLISGGIILGAIRRKPRK